MTPAEAVFTAKLGAEHGPAALAVLYAVGAAGGEWTGADAELAGLIGCSLRHLQSVRTALVAAGVLTYSSVQRGGPRVYRVRPAAAESGSADHGGNGCPVRHSAPAPPSLPAWGAVADEVESPQPATVPAPGKNGRKPLPTDPLFDVIVSFAYGGIRPKDGGRIAKIAVEMVAAGLGADRMKTELPAVVAKYAPHRTTLDMNTITACWRWILSPPAVVGKAGKPSEGDLARSAMANGNPWATPTQTQGTE